jgi:hypothetical protein
VGWIELAAKLVAERGWCWEGEVLVRVECISRVNEEVESRAREFGYDGAALLVRNVAPLVDDGWMWIMYDWNMFQSQQDLKDFLGERMKQSRR